MKRKLLIFISCFLMVFVTTFSDNVKPVYAIGLTWDTFTDPKKIILLLVAAGITVSALTTDTVDTFSEAVYNGLSNAGKTVVKSTTVVGDNLMIPINDFKQFAFDLYVTMGLDSFLSLDGKIVNGQFVPNVQLTRIDSTNKTATTTTTNSTYTVTTFSSLFTIGAVTYTFKNSNVTFYTSTTEVLGLGSGNFVKKPTTGGYFRQVSYQSYPAIVPASYFYGTSTSNRIATCYVVNLDDYTSWPANSTNWYKDGNKFYFRGDAFGVYDIDPASVSTITYPYSNLPTITLDNPIYPNGIDNTVPWDSVTVPGDIDLYPDWTYVDNDLVLGGVTLPVNDLTNDAVTHPILDIPVTNPIDPILDVLIHLPAYLEGTADAINDFANTLVDAASGAVGATIGAIGGWLGNILKDIFGGLQSILDYLGTMLTDLITSMGALGAYIVSGITGWFTDIVNKIGGFIDDLRSLINFLTNLFKILWNFFVRLINLIYQVLFLGVFTALSGFILNLKNLMAILPNPLDDISVVMIDITVFMTMLGVVFKVLSMRKGQ